MRPEIALSIALGAFGAHGAAVLKSPAELRRTPLRRQDLPPVDSTELQAAIEITALLDSARELESIAYANDGNRATGSQGHNDTVTYIYNELSALNYYNLELQPWSTLVDEGGNATFSVDGTEYDPFRFEYSPAGSADAPIVVVNNLGCEATDYPAEVSGSVALITRGTCDFGLKSALAGAAGATAAIISNNVPSEIVGGTLGVPPRPEGDYVPTIGVSQSLGDEFRSAITGGATLTAVIDVTGSISNKSTINLLATTTGGDQDNVLMLGAHADSVAEGPGINDDGSGTVGNLEVAKQLASYSTTNAVRFGWWSGEEQGLLGSTFYVENLPAEEASKIKLYLNFDMIASPNYIYAIYDGDGSAFNITGPAGSAEAEHFFEQYFEANNLPSEPTAFDGRSDYGPFLDAGIASGGLFTGAEENKTEEQAALFGGTAGIALDPNYHQAGDNVTNLNEEAFLVNTKAIADAVAVFGTSFDSLNQTTAANKRMTKRTSSGRVARPKEMLRREAATEPQLKPRAVWNLSPTAAKGHQQRAVKTHRGDKKVQRKAVKQTK